MVADILISSSDCYLTYLNQKHKFVRLIHLIFHLGLKGFKAHDCLAIATGSKHQRVASHKTDTGVIILGLSEWTAGISRGEFVISRCIHLFYEGRSCWSSVALESLHAVGGCFDNMANWPAIPL